MGYYSFNNLPVTLNSNCSSCVGASSLNSRFLLELSFSKTNEQTAVVILMNPSSTAKETVFYDLPLANITDIDSTTYHIIDVLINKRIKLDEENHKFDKLVILNLFPYYSANPKDLGAIISQNKCRTALLLNELIISNTINQYKNSYFFCGWGKNPAIKSEINYIKQKFLTICHANAQNIYCMKFGKKDFEKMPLNTKLLYIKHGSSW